MKNKDLVELITDLKNNQSFSNHDIGTVFVNAVYSIPNKLIYETSSDIPERNRKKAVMQHIRRYFKTDSNISQDYELVLPHQNLIKSKSSKPQNIELEFLTYESHLKGVSLSDIGTKVIDGAKEYHEGKPEEIKQSGRDYKLFTEYNAIVKHLKELGM